MSNQDYYQKGGDGYQASNVSGDSRFYNIKMELDQLADGSRVLDIGCGDMLMSRAKPNLKWEGIDICPLPGVTVHDLTKFPYPFPDKSFDAVLCSEVLEHLFDPVAVLAEANRVLKPGGKIFVTVPNYDNLDWHLQSHREQVFNPDKVHSVEHIRQYTPYSMLQLLERNGFEVTGHIGNSPHMCKWLEKPRDVLASVLPQSSSVEIDRLLGVMFPDTCIGFLMIAKKK